MGTDRNRTSDTADDGASQTPAYTAAEAAHAIQEFLDGALSLQGFTEWLNGYPYSPDGPAPQEVEDEINRATLAVRRFHATRDGEALRQELMDIRSRLSGLAYSAGQEIGTGDRVSPSGRPIDRSFP